MNFAITGYGPNQYAEVARTFIPRYHPDIVIIGFFMNDFTDDLGAILIFNPISVSICRLQRVGIQP